MACSNCTWHLICGRYFQNLLFVSTTQNNPSAFQRTGSNTELPWLNLVLSDQPDHWQTALMEARSLLMKSKTGRELFGLDKDAKENCSKLGEPSILTIDTEVSTKDVFIGVCIEYVRHSVRWTETCAGQAQFCPLISSGQPVVHTAKLLCVVNRDACAVGEWVVYQAVGPQGPSVRIGKVLEIINKRPADLKGIAHSVLIQRSIVGDVHGDWRMPRIQPLLQDKHLVPPYVSK